MRTEQEITRLLKQYEADMVKASKRGEKAERKEDREDQLQAQREWDLLYDASQILKWVLGRETDVKYNDMFPAGS